MTDYVKPDKELTDRLQKDCTDIAERYKKSIEIVLEKYHSIHQEHKGYTYLQAIHKTRTYFRWSNNDKDTNSSSTSQQRPG